jgi:HEAT repeat protein
MTKFEVLLDQMFNDAKPPRRANAFDRLLTEFPDRKAEVINAILEHGDDPLRKSAMLLLAREGDTRGLEWLATAMDDELKSTTVNFEHWMWLSTYLEIYAKRRDARVVTRFFPYITIANSDLGFNVIKAIRELKIKAGVAALLKAAALSNPPYINQEYAIGALGELGGKECIETLLAISRTAGSISKRLAQEAIEKIRGR